VSNPENLLDSSHIVRPWRKALLAGTLLMTAACQPVGFVGDSILGVSADEIDQELRPNYIPTFAAQNGQRIDQMLDELEVTLTQEKPPSIIVINLGTNDVVQENENWRSSFDQMMEMLSDVPCVGLTQVNEYTDDYYGSTNVTAIGINAAIDEAVAANPDRIFKIDFNIDWEGEMQRQNPNEPHYYSILITDPNSPYYGIYIGDGVHPSPEGQQLLAERTLAGLDANC
jgi:lysophospholipase L1-like esterase